MLGTINPARTFFSPISGPRICPRDAANFGKPSTQGRGGTMHSYLLLDVPSPVSDFVNIPLDENAKIQYAT